MCLFSKGASGGGQQTEEERQAEVTKRQTKETAAKDLGLKGRGKRPTAERRRLNISRFAVNIASGGAKRAANSGV